MPHLCSRVDRKQRCGDLCKNSHKTLTSRPEFNPADSCRGVSKNGKFVTGHKIEEMDFSQVQACQPEKNKQEKIRTKPMLQM